MYKSQAYETKYVVKYNILSGSHNGLKHAESRKDVPFGVRTMADRIYWVHFLKKTRQNGLSLAPSSVCEQNEAE